MGQYSSVGIATGYVFDGSGIEFLWGRDFPHPSGPALGSNHLLYNVYRVSFLETKRPQRGFKHPPTSRAEVKERLEL